jgi:MoxR-like ATPase
MRDTSTSDDLTCEDELAETQGKLDRLRNNLRRVIRGKDEQTEILTVSLIAGGSVLMEDVPGVGKTTLAKALAISLDAEFHRLQFTPDLLPADILGSSVYNPGDGTFEFHPGPIFCNVLLADEINRASPRTQSALLEAMSERQATIEGHSYPLPAPFLVLATENPIEFHGTYPLPESQMDRFLIYMDLGYPGTEVEVDILEDHARAHPLESLEPVLSTEEIVRMQETVRTVRVEETLRRYIVELVEATRTDGRLRLGASPRASLGLYRASQASALAAGRPYVLPDDVQRLARYVLPHRLILSSKAKYEGVKEPTICEEILDKVPVPT